MCGLVFKASVGAQAALTAGRGLPLSGVPKSFLPRKGTESISYAKVNCTPCKAVRVCSICICHWKQPGIHWVIFLISHIDFLCEGACRNCDFTMACLQKATETKEMSIKAQANPQTNSMGLFRGQFPGGSFLSSEILKQSFWSGKE